MSGRIKYGFVIQEWADRSWGSGFIWSEFPEEAANKVAAAVAQKAWEGCPYLTEYDFPLKITVRLLCKSCGTFTVHAAKKLIFYTARK